MKYLLSVYINIMVSITVYDKDMRRDTLGLDT